MTKDTKEFTTVKVRKEHMNTLLNLLPHQSTTKTLEILLDLMINNNPTITKLIGDTISSRINFLNNIDSKY